MNTDNYSQMPRRLDGNAASAFSLMLLMLSFGSASAQYAITWFTIDGGGGTSTGGAFSVTGTIGQVDAGPVLTAGGFRLTGGFWAFPTAVQTPGAPTLLISPSGQNQALISWSPNVAGYILEEAGSVAGSNWTPAPSGSTNPVIVPLSLPARFYRLCRQ